jgi:hypothetical protein
MYESVVLYRIPVKNEDHLARAAWGRGRIAAL